MKKRFQEKRAFGEVAIHLMRSEPKTAKKKAMEELQKLDEEARGLRLLLPVRPGLAGQDGRIQGISPTRLG